MQRSKYGCFTSGLVTPMTMVTLQRGSPAPLLHHLHPLITYESPSRVMLQEMFVASLDATPGSVITGRNVFTSTCSLLSLSLSLSLSVGSPQPLTLPFIHTPSVSPLHSQPLPLSPSLTAPPSLSPSLIAPPSLPFTHSLSLSPPHSQPLPLFPSLTAPPSLPLTHSPSLSSLHL